MRPAAFTLALLLLLLAFAPSAPLAAACTYSLGFQALHDKIPDVVGACVSDVVHDPASGDASQQTTNGLLAWRKADNWTAFTNGATTWIDGPYGVQSRPNHLRYGWEAGGPSPADRPVLAIYYPWFSPSTFEVSIDQPAGGPYQSDDPATIRNQVRQAKGAGIDGFVSSWFGQRERTDQNFNTLLDIAQQEGFTATIYFETDHFLPWGPDDMAWQLERFYEDHLDHPSLVRYQGKPVIFFWRTRVLDLGTWAAMRARVDPEHHAVWIAEGDVFGQLAGDTFDGIHPYSTAWSANPAATLATYSQRTHAYPGKLWVPTAMPGYDDSRLRPGGSLVVPRNDGAFYRATFQGAIDSSPDWAILITSWNEWLEGSQIEPAASYGNHYLDLTREYSTQFKNAPR